MKISLRALLLGPKEKRDAFIGALTEEPNLLGPNGEINAIELATCYTEGKPGIIEITKFDVTTEELLQNLNLPADKRKRKLVVTINPEGKTKWWPE